MEHETGSDEWVGEGLAITERQFYRAMLARAQGPVGGRYFPVEVRCPRDGHLRWEARLRARFMPFWMWRVYRRWVRIRMVTRLVFAGRCPQCKFDAEVRGW